ncbi:MAG: hypothetical protein J5J06_07065 [Phycisphaerae bacterium]|nr:hypothetical protein [Phycisphaerae bacterium]
MPETAANPALSNTPQREGMRETIESIVIALVLAFVFRAFIVEAFVIPTGSMAPTLLGAHGTIICEDCGTEFTYGLKDPGDPREIQQVKPNSIAICPNCNHPNNHLEENDVAGNAERGDRILVLKWLYDLPLPGVGPHRWDVTVFKDPADGTTNFIKRLVGMPNEVLMIADGDLYAAPVAELSEATKAEFAALRVLKHELLSGRRGTLPQLSTSAREELDRKFHIVRKTPAAQYSLWHLVFDNDYRPRTLDPSQPRWHAALGDAGGWNTETTVLRFQSTGLAEDYAVLIGKDIRAFTAYNIYGPLPQPVSDLRVRLVFTPRSADAELLIRLEKLGRVFWGRIRADGAVGIFESLSAVGAQPSSRSLVETRVEPIPPGRSVEFSFENVDYRLAIRVGENEVASSSDDPDSPAYYGPDLKALRGQWASRSAPPPRLYGASGAFELSHVLIDRDEYYYHDPGGPGLELGWAPRGGWGSVESPILLGPDEYFMLGDNTQASKDSRLWDVVGPHLWGRGTGFQLGTVPGDQLIGRAFFVYWPQPHRLPWLPALRWGVIPDVGNMRWIR